MERMEITSMSSRGQVVIPQSLREQLKLKEGERFMVSIKEGNIVLKKLEHTSFEKFDEFIKIARQHAKDNNLTPKDVELIIKKVRNENNTRY